VSQICYKLLIKTSLYIDLTAKVLKSAAGFGSSKFERRGFPLWRDRDHVTILGIRESIDGFAYPWISIIEPSSSDARFQGVWIMLAILMLELTTNSATFTVQSGCWDSETPYCNVVIAFIDISVSNVKQKRWRLLWIREVPGANLGHIQGDTAGFEALVAVQLKSPFLWEMTARQWVIGAWRLREHRDNIFEVLMFCWPCISV
jgi:hypothetical protein